MCSLHSEIISFHFIIFIGPDDNLSNICCSLLLDSCYLLWKDCTLQGRKTLQKKGFEYVCIFQSADENWMIATLFKKIIF